MNKTNNTQTSPSKYDRIKYLKDTQFKRLTGIQRTTFKQMVEILTVADTTRKTRGGRPSKLCIEDQLLLALEYLRDYPTYFRLGQNYDVSESYAFKIHRWVEDTLIKDKRFHLPGKKALLKSDTVIEVALVDASESPVERPKKDKDDTTLVKRKDILPKVR